MDMTGFDPMKEPKSERVHLVLTASELRAIDNSRFARRMGSRSKVIRLLLELGLCAGEESAAPVSADTPHALRDES